MRYTVSSNENIINWNAKDNERIVQNVRNILNTMQYEVAYDRVFGRSTDILDNQFQNIQGQLIAETFELIDEYEPRASVKDVFVNQLENGEIDIKVVIEIE